jgi:uncharacterized protein (TIGR02452 family)
MEGLAQELGTEVAPTDAKLFAAALDDRSDAGEAHELNQRWSSECGLNQGPRLSARRLVETGSKPLALTFANGVQPGGGFLGGARAQEEVLCRSSALYHTIFDDQVYAEHRECLGPESTDWVIYRCSICHHRLVAGATVAWALPRIVCSR